MSGDVQPRKRKDKKRKRDAFDRKSEGEVTFSRQQSVQDDDESSHGVHITKMAGDDVHLHVHEDHGTGGHWCAKVFFFGLLVVLLGLVGLIILENRGLSDLDTPLSESRFSNYFDGWVEEHREEHEEHDAVAASIEDHDDHDEPFEEEEDHSENYPAALKVFSLLTQKYPDKPQTFLGKAKSLDHLSERQRSNQLLSDALEAYKRYLAFGDVIANATEYRAAAERCIERMRFMGNDMQAVPIHEQLIERFSDEPNPRNQLAVTFLLINRLSDAKAVLKETLSRWPLDGFAQVHYGFVLKQHDNDYENAIKYLKDGIDSKAEGTQDGRFFSNLGEALQRLGRQSEALEVYRHGADLQLFPSVYQRSMYNEPRLRAQPFWTKQESTYAKFLTKLEQNWLAIRDEGLSVLSKSGYFMDEAENLRDSGDWQQFELYARGQRKQGNCQKAPITCSLIAEFGAAINCRRGQVKFSVMHPGTHVWPHCGPTNCRLRGHLGLIVPAGTRIRVADEESTWSEGKFLLFDDSFEHEVWHNGSSLRLVLIVDIWHPDLSEQRRRSITPI